MGSDVNIVLFDGVCNLCNGFVQFLIRQDRSNRLRFGSLQSEKAQYLISEKIPGSKMAGSKEASGPGLISVVYLRRDRYYTKSSAALKILQDLGGLWQLAGIFRLIPRPLRDVVYEWVGRNRYRWFGKQGSCIVPTPELRERFID